MQLPTIPKPVNHPRWINTEAGQWAWAVDEEWRAEAAQALAVSDRRVLLDAAEQKWQQRDQVSS